MRGIEKCVSDALVFINEFIFIDEFCVMASRLETGADTVRASNNKRFVGGLC